MGTMSLPMRRCAVAIALQRYSGVPDVEDRVGDALLALVEADHDFRPRPGKDGPGYRARYALGQVAGTLREQAQIVKKQSAAEIAATDLGITSLFFDSPSQLFAADRLWVVNGKVTPERVIVESTDDSAKTQAVLNTLAADIESLYENPEPDLRFIYDFAAPPLFVSNIPNAEEVLEASQNNAFWDDTEAPVIEIRTDGEATRPVGAMARDRAAWPEGVLDAWSEARAAWHWVADPKPILEFLAGEDIFLPEDPCVHEVVGAMEQLEVAVTELVEDDHHDTVARSVARTLAERIVSDGLTAKPDDGSMVETLREAFITLLNAEPDEWKPAPLPTAEILKAQVEDWLAKLKCWPSQRIGIQALLDGASPWEARQAEQAWFAAH